MNVEKGQPSDPASGGAARKEEENIQIVDLSRLERKLRQRKVREALGAMCEEEYSVIRWRPLKQRPAEASYILIKCLEEDGKHLCCTDACYENGKFLFLYSDGDTGEINERIILGWSYYPFDDRLEE